MRSLDRSWHSKLLLLCWRQTEQGGNPFIVSEKDAASEALMPQALQASDVPFEQVTRHGNTTCPNTTATQIPGSDGPGQQDHGQDHACHTSALQAGSSVPCAVLRMLWAGRGMKRGGVVGGGGGLEPVKPKSVSR